LASRAGSKHILIADDAASSRDLLRAILETASYEVSEAANGEQALEMAVAFKPDLIVLDLQMPKLGGYEAAAVLRAMPGLALTPIVALTAAATHTWPKRLFEAGFSAYLVKPIGPAKLRECIAALLFTTDGL